ncbi:MAG: crotonobetainyl-CoA:carnitine CoA-transferase CaiB-like acyl-CoA transferase [Flavobacteriales bacterium]|jgi:crotonobetainyl-CoA:carnitine CoA-transferase CaiB-like acyl-CoA transferase
MNNKILPLQGIKVVEFAHMVMGPTVGLILADLGAEVVKVEPLNGDKTRHLEGSGAGYFPMYNRNKKSLCVDLKSEPGKQVALRLIAKADVVIENFRLGAMEKLGLGYEQLASSNPRLIYCSLKGFLSGPYGNRTALDEVAQMMGGLAYMTGLPGKPMRAGSSVIDITGGMFGVIGILSAVERRHTTGMGGMVTSSLFETTVFMMGQHMAQQAVSGEAAMPMSQRQSAWSIYDVFRCKEGESVFVGVVSDTLWVKFCKAFELYEFSRDSALESNSGRIKARDIILPVVSDLFASMNKQDLMDRLEAAGIPFAPINRPQDLNDDPHLVAGKSLLTVTLSDGKRAGIEARLPALPLDMSGEKSELRFDLPREGEHSVEVMRDAGYTADEIDQMLRDGFVKVAD